VGGAGGVCARLVAAHTSTALAALPSVANRVRFRNFEWFIIVVTIWRLLRPRLEGRIGNQRIGSSPNCALGRAHARTRNVDCRFRRNVETIFRVE
jgi:hypothetical protein